ncbi:hypothetical protein HZZ00_01980 [Streptomyces sp. NEAU-sy36]|uniref:hypothetical protein n=1 Tax=unclassified Streptomyces TaxID=2593676 RepID=UPI0015D59336|nr:MULTISPECIES: hypothetical protein [unclassified Streptomyces]QLI99869.1 hypothetical protein HZZ00_01980 [Streptomyces sp. NEAU-sy36]
MLASPAIRVFATGERDGRVFGRLHGRIRHVRAGGRAGRRGRRGRAHPPGRPAPLCHTQDTLGGPEAAAAFDAFAAAWLDEAATLESALHELAGKVRLAKRAYHGGDHTAAERAASVTVGRPSALTGY